MRTVLLALFCLLFVRNALASGRSVAFVLSTDGASKLQSGSRVRVLDDADEIFAGDIVVLGPGGRVQLSLYNSRKTATLTGAGRVKLTNQHATKVAGSTKIVVSMSRPLVVDISRHDTGPAMDQIRGGPSELKLTAPIGGQRVLPAEVRWDPIKVAAPRPGSDPPSLTISVARVDSSERFERRLAIDADHIEVPPDVFQNPGRYVVTLAAFGEGVGSKVTYRETVIADPETLAALDAAAASLPSQTDSAAWLDVAVGYRRLQLWTEAGETYARARSRFPQDRTVRNAADRFTKFRNSAR